MQQANPLATLKIRCIAWFALLWRFDPMLYNTAGRKSASGWHYPEQVMKVPQTMELNQSCLSLLNGLFEFLYTEMQLSE